MPQDRRMQSPLEQPFVPPALPAPFWGGKRNCVGLGAFSDTRGARDAPALELLPGNYLGPREISVALANRIILSV